MFVTSRELKEEFKSFNYMKIYQISTSGQFHINHNEDYYIICEIGNDSQLIAVMDGCSMRTDSYFISTLIGKILRKTAKEIHYKEFIEKKRQPLDFKLRFILERLFEYLKLVKNQLDLRTDEISSTLILGLVNISDRIAKLITIGDGLICHDGNLIEYEQGNRPDYLGYHLDQDFEDWYDNQIQKLSVNKFCDLSISTDGIFTFDGFNMNEYDDVSEEELLTYFLVNREGNENPEMLHQKLNSVKMNWGLKPNDDFTIIRLILDEK